MSIESTLLKVEEELSEGKLGIARDRLHGLVASYPEDLSLRSRLAEVYLKLGYPVEAGRWWFLVEKLTPEQESAVRDFVLSYGGNEALILRKLRLKVIPQDGFAHKRIEELMAAARAKGQTIPRISEPPLVQKSSHWAITGCMAVAIVCVVLMLIGLSTVFKALFP